MKRNKLACLLLATAASSTASAIPLLSNNDLDTTHTLVTFNELTNGTVVDDEYLSTGMLISGTQGINGTGSAAQVIAYDWWDPIYIGSEESNWSGSITFTFLEAGVTQFGIDVIDAFDNWLSVFDSNGTLLETVNANAIDNDQFLGIDTGNAAIAYAIVSGDYFAADNIRFNRDTVITPDPDSTPVDVPEPSTYSLLLLGLLALIYKSSLSQGRRAS